MLIPPGLRDVIPPGISAFLSSSSSGSGDRDPRQDRQFRRWASPAFAPFDYQADVIGGLIARAGTAEGIGMLMLPTGAGKTSTAVATVLRDLKSLQSTDALVVWIAPQIELLSQAAGSFERVWAAGEGPDSVDVSFPRSSADAPADGRPAVLLSTPLAAAKFIHNHGLAARVRYLVFDEAHHLGAERFGEAWRQLVHSSPSMRLVLGLSATPTRSESSTFSDLEDALDRRVFYPKKLLPDPAATLTARGVLAEVALRLVPGVPAHCARFDRTDDALKALTGEPDYWMACIQCAADFHSRLIVYCPERTSGRLFAAHLRAIGVSAEYIDGEDSYGARIAVLERFRDGRTSVLVNVQLLLEGIDAPSAAGALITYPIQSTIRLSQIVGRVMRGTLLGGTSTATVMCANPNMLAQLQGAVRNSDYGGYWSRGVAL
jgi:superfamily II DNA or RNA helicase